MSYRTPEKVFVLYDGRAKSGTTLGAAVLVASIGERQRKHDAELFRGQDAVWYEYEVAPDGVTLLGEKMREDLSGE